jgi:hypothetical protein
MVEHKALLLVLLPHLDALSLSQLRGAKRKRLHQVDLTQSNIRSAQPPTSCGWSGLKALHIVCFSLVTLRRLLY